MYASVAGLKAHMQKLTVIGNNVANVNTQGYKKQRTVFRNSIYSMYSAGSNGTSSVGGKNPSQLGYGSKIGSIDLNMSSSSYNPGNTTDCALVGDGFFLVGDKTVVNSTAPEDYYNDFSAENLKSLNLTRVGDFHFGPDNYLVDGQGNVVYGFMATSEKDELTGQQIISDQLVPIRLPRWDVDDNHTIKYARTDVAVERNANGDIVDFEVDAQAAAGQRRVAHQLVDDMPAFNAGEDEENIPEEYEFAELDSISIDAKTGCISGISTADEKPVVIGYLAIGKVTNPNGVTHIGDSYYRCGDGAGELSITMLGGVQKDIGIDHVNGSMLPTEYPDGVEREGDPSYWPGTDILSGDTEMMVGFLEAPNVDLAEEITELITTQRGYQANTRIITVTDSMLEELVNMKR